MRIPGKTDINRLRGATEAPHTPPTYSPHVLALVFKVNGFAMDKRARLRTQGQGRAASIPQRGGSDQALQKVE